MKIYKKDDNKVQLDDYRDNKGNLIVVSDFSDDGRMPGKITYRMTSPSNYPSFLDVKMDEDTRLSSGEMWILNSTIQYVTENDYVEMSIIDKDDILGLFSYYGVPAGGVIELSKFVKTNYVKHGNADDGYYTKISFTKEIATAIRKGLYVRIGYYSDSTSSILADFRLELFLEG